MPHITPGYWQQADTLYLPNDKGYVYALVICDVGSRLVDAVEMKSRDPEDVIIAFNKIYRRKILSKPKVLTTDAGTEFRGKVEQYLTSIGIHHNMAKVVSHRSVSLAERKNQTIGKIIHKIILKVELVSRGKNSSSQWVQYLPNIIAMINKKVHEAKVAKVSDKPTYNLKHKVDLLSVGQQVRVALDNPVDIHGKPKFGGFRSSDHRWATTIRTIKFLLMKPNEPVMYLLDGKFGDKKIECTGYTRNQLQKVSRQEVPEHETVAPVPIEEDRFEFEKILESKKVGNRLCYLIKWKGYHKKHSTWEARSELMKDVPQAVLTYEKNIQTNYSISANPKASMTSPIALSETYIISPSTGLVGVATFTTRITDKSLVFIVKEDGEFKFVLLDGVTDSKLLVDHPDVCFTCNWAVLDDVLKSHLMGST